MNNLTAVRTRLRQKVTLANFIQLIACVWVLTMNLAVMNPQYAHAQGTAFSPPLNLSQSATDSLFQQIRTDSQGNIYVVWEERQSPGNYQILFTRSTDGGIQFTTRINLSPTSGQSQQPQMELDPQGNINVLYWHDDGAGNVTLRFTRSSDGVNFSTPSNISGGTVGPSDTRRRQMVVDANGEITVLWQSLVATTGQPAGVFISRSNDGVNFSSTFQIPTIPNSGEIPHLAIDSQGNITVGWVQVVSIAPVVTCELFTTRSIDGTNFSLPNSISVFPCGSFTLRLAVDSQDGIHVAWTEGAGSTAEAFYSKSADGINYSAPVNVSNLPGSNDVKIAIDHQDNINLAWYVSSGDVYSSRSADGINFSVPINLSSSVAGEKFDQQIAIDSQNRVYVVWANYDSVTSVGDVYFQKSGDGVNFTNPFKLSVTSENNYGAEITIGDFDPHVVWLGGNISDILYIRSLPDSDGDGVPDNRDNCPVTPNPTQIDSDGDGIGDACDRCPFDLANDADGDGVCADVDNCPFVSNANQRDSDGDGIGDVCDPNAFRPVAQNDSYSTNTNTLLTVLAPGVLGNDTDVDGNNTMTARQASGPSHAASFTLNSNGSFSYRPTNNYVGTDSFTYRANDGEGNSNTATVTITVNAVIVTPVITWNNPADITFGTALSGAQLNAAANTAGTFTYLPTEGAVLNSGIGQVLHVDFVPNDTVNYTNASKDVFINVIQATPTISISNIPSNAVFGGSFTPTYSYTGDGTTSVTSSTTGTCTVSGTVVNYVGAGTCTLVAHATAGSNFAAVDGTAQSFTIAQATPAPLPTGLVSWWNGDLVSGATAFDLGSGINGTLVNGTTTAPGKVGNAFSFDGIDDFVSIPSSASLVPTNAVSVNVWAKINSLPDAAAHLIDAKLTGVGKPQGLIYLLFSSSDGRSGFGVTTTSGPTFAYGFTNIVGDGQFHHLAGTWDGSEVKLYVDGVLEGSALTSGTLVSGSEAEIIIGDHNPAIQGRRVDGLLDEVQIFHRALSVAEIQSIYLAGSAGVSKPSPAPLPAGLVSWWDGDLVSGTTAFDLGSGINGTMVNGATTAPGKVGNAFSFDGIDDSVVVPDSTNLNVTTQFTLDAWINPNSLQQDPAQGAIVSKVGGGAGNNGYQFGLTGLNEILYCQFNAPGESWATNSLAVTLPSPIPVGQWSHVACTYDNANLKIIVNGVLAGSLFVGAKTVANSAANLRISGDDNFNGFFHGLIDEVQLFNRALSNAEIQSIYLAGSAGVNKGTTRIFWNNPADIFYGTALSGTQLNATANTAGTFTYAPAADALLSVGNGQILHVDFVPGDMVNYTNASKDVFINVLRATPTISINNIPTSAVFGGSFTPTYSYTGDGATSVSSSTGSTCTVSSGVVNFVGTGTCTLIAHATAGTNYAAVNGADQSFTIAQATPTISINNIPAGAVYGGSFTPTVDYNGDGTTSVTSSTTGTCTVINGVVNYVGAGPCTLVAHATAGTNYAAVDGTDQSFTIAQATPTISITNIPPPNAVYGGSFIPTFAYTGDGIISVTSSTNSRCTVTGGVVNFVGGGLCTLTAQATATANVTAATGSPQTFTISPALATISITNIPPPNAVYGGSFTPTYAYNGNGKTSSTSSTPTKCTVANNGVVSFVGVGTCTLTANAAATTDYQAATGPAQSFSIGQATTMISIKNIPNNAKKGNNFTPTYIYTGDGTTKSTTSSTPATCTVSGTVVSFVNSGPCTLTAHATAGVNYMAVDGSAQSFTIKP